MKKLPAYFSRIDFFFSTGQTAQKQKFCTTKSPLMQDWVFRLGNCQDFLTKFVIINNHNHLFVACGNSPGGKKNYSQHEEIFAAWWKKKITFCRVDKKGFLSTLFFWPAKDGVANFVGCSKFSTPCSFYCTEDARSNFENLQKFLKFGFFGHILFELFQNKSCYNYNNKFSFTLCKKSYSIDDNNKVWQVFFKIGLFWLYFVQLLQNKSTTNFFAACPKNLFWSRKWQSKFSLNLAFLSVSCSYFSNSILWTNILPACRTYSTGYLINKRHVVDVVIVSITAKPYILQKILNQWICCKCLAW